MSFSKPKTLRINFRKRNVSKEQISIPQDFEHISHTDVTIAKKFLEVMDTDFAKNGSYDYDTMRVRFDELSPIEDKKRPLSTLPWIGEKDKGKLREDKQTHFFSEEEEEEEEDGENELENDKPVSEVTEEKVVVAKLWMENYFDRLLHVSNERGTRKERLEKQLDEMGLTEEKKIEMRKSLSQKESDYTRLRRKKVTKDCFEEIKVIGRGAFGVVKLVVEKETGQLYAMKVIRKADMIKKKQEGHVRAERDVLAAASHLICVVKLYLSFQDKQNLYFVMEYMAGGDLLNLLIKKDVFTEDFAKFYIAEMVAAIDSVHKLGFIHRDIKPDNFLLTADGHLKISDFGLCTGFHWAHDSKFYEAQRRIALKKMGDGTSSSQTTKDETTGKKEKEWRDKHERRLAFSIVGTNNYIAPEVLLQVGYNQECDWWSLGVILFEMLYGYPPFSSENKQTTKLKIINWQKTLKFPSKVKISSQAKDLISKLICDPQDRLGRNGAEEVKNHPFFEGIDWNNLVAHRTTAPWKPSLKSPTDTSCFDEIKVSTHKDPPLETDYDLYGFTYRGFYNLTREEREKVEFNGKKMDPLQAAVLELLEDDLDSSSVKRRSRSSTM